MRSWYGMNNILKNSKKIWFAALFLVVLCGCLEKPTADRSNRKNVSESRMTATPVPPTATPTATPKPEATKRPTKAPTKAPTSTPSPTPLPYTAAEEILRAGQYSGKVQIKDTVLALPCRLSEIMQIPGVVLEQSQYSALEGYDPLNNIFESESGNTFVLIFEDGTEAELEVENLSLVSQPLEDLYVTELTSESPCIFFPGGVRVGDHCRILKEWKEYDKLYAGSYVARYEYYEAQYLTDYNGMLELGVQFEIEVNNTSYAIEKVVFTPSFYVNTVQVREVVQNSYPEDLKHELPIALDDNWKTGLIVYEDRYFLVDYQSSYLYETPKTPEELLEKLGRDFKYYRTDGWEGWDYYLDTSPETNTKTIVQDNDIICTVINAWDYSDVDGENGVLINGIPMFPREKAWKEYAEVGIIYNGYIDLWMFSVSALDQGEIPGEVREIFRQVVQRMAETVVEYKEK